MVDPAKKPYRTWAEVLCAECGRTEALARATGATLERDADDEFRCCPSCDGVPTRDTADSPCPHCATNKGVIARLVVERDALRRDYAKLEAAKDHEIAALRARKAELTIISDKYWELIYAVASKFPGESRHETALRYIQESEWRRSNPEGEAQRILRGEE